MLPLNIFEERYKLLMREARDFGVVLIRSGREVGSGRDPHSEEPVLFSVGTLAHPDQIEALADGRFNVVARGLHRFRVLSLERSRPYLQAVVEVLPEPAPTGAARLMVLLEEYLRLHGLEVTPQLTPGVGKRAVWLAGSLLQAEAAKRQRLLESGEAALAEAMLEAEVARLRRLRGPLAPFTPELPSAN